MTMPLGLSSGSKPEPPETPAAMKGYEKAWDPDHTSTLDIVVTAALQSTKSLYETVKSFKDRHKTLRRLQAELEDLTNILNSLIQVINAETSM